MGEAGRAQRLPSSVKGSWAWAPCLQLQLAGGRTGLREKKRFLPDCPGQLREGEGGRRLHSNVPFGSGASSWLQPPLGWMFQKSESCWVKARGRRKKRNSTSFAKRPFAFPMNRYPRMGRGRKDAVGSNTALTSNTALACFSLDPSAAWMESFSPSCSSFLPSFPSHSLNKTLL